MSPQYTRPATHLIKRRSQQLVDKGGAAQRHALPRMPPSARATTARPATTLRRSRTKKGAQLRPWVQVFGSGAQARVAELGAVPEAAASILYVVKRDQRNVPGCSTLRVSWQTNYMSLLKGLSNKNAVIVHLAHYISLFLGY